MHGRDSIDEGRALIRRFAGTPRSLAKPGIVVVVCLMHAAVWGQTFEPQPGWSQPVGFDGDLGRGVATAGDVYAGGFDGVIVGGPLYYTPCCPSSNQQGLTLTYRGAATGLAGVYDWYEVGPETWTSLAWRVACGGDIDGDGHDDVIFSSGSSDATHQVHVRFGSPAGLSRSWDFDTGEQFLALGPSVDGNGDINDDGHPDVIAGFPRSDGDRGRIRAFFGSNAGLPSWPDWERVGTTGQGFGWGVAFAGDVNDDGHDDMLTCDGYVTDSDDRYELYLGDTSGFGANAAWSYPRSSSSGSCASHDPLDGIGDVNGDGYADVAIGEPRAQHAYGQGQVLIFHGSADGLESEPARVLFGDGDFGHAVAGMGDVNGDGIDDVAVGAPRLSEDPSEGGRVYLFLGSTLGVQPEAAWVNDPVPGSFVLGWSLSPAGDVNGDGLIDLVVGDPAVEVAHVFYGVQPLLAGGAGAIDPAVGALRMARDANGDVVLSWSASCLSSEKDYEVYRGALGDFASHEPVACSTGGATTWTVTGNGGSAYYLVVPRSLDHEGSYGSDGQAAERPGSTAACLPQWIAGCS